MGRIGPLLSFCGFLAFALLLQLAAGTFDADLAGYPDEPSHFVGGLMVRDYIAEGFPAPPLEYARSYYSRYPKVAIGHWPPGFYALEGIWLLIFGPTKAAAIMLLTVISAGAAWLVARVIEPMNRAEAEQVRQLGEIEYNLRARSEAVSWIRSNPEQFLSLTARRAILYWFPDLDPLRALILACLSLFSFAGTALLFRHEPAAGLALATCLLVHPLPHYFVHVGVRYKYPTDWIGVLGAGLLVVAAWSLFREHYSGAETYSPARARA